MGSLENLLAMYDKGFCLFKGNPMAFVRFMSTTYKDIPLEDIDEKGYLDVWINSKYRGKFRLCLFDGRTYTISCENDINVDSCIVSYSDLIEIYFTSCQETISNLFKICGYTLKDYGFFGSNICYIETDLFGEGILSKIEYDATKNNYTIFYYEGNEYRHISIGTNDRVKVHYISQKERDQLRFKTNFIPRVKYA